MFSTLLVPARLATAASPLPGLQLPITARCSPSALPHRWRPIRAAAPASPSTTACCCATSCGSAPTRRSASTTGCSSALDNMARWFGHAPHRRCKPPAWACWAAVCLDRAPPCPRLKPAQLTPCPLLCCVASSRSNLASDDGLQQLQYILNGMFGRACKNLGNPDATALLAKEVGDVRETLVNKLAGEPPPALRCAVLPAARCCAMLAKEVGDVRETLINKLAGEPPAALCCGDDVV